MSNAVPIRRADGRALRSSAGSSAVGVMACRALDMVINEGARTQAAPQARALRRGGWGGCGARRAWGCGGGMAGGFGGGTGRDRGRERGGGGKRGEFRGG